MSFSIYQLLTAIVVLAVVVMGILFLAGFNLNSFANFLPDFGDADEDKKIKDVEIVKKLQGNESCCCLYEGTLGTLNKGNCQIVEVENEKFCKDVLGLGWARVENIFCLSEQICQYGNDDDLDGKIDCEDKDCDGKSCGDEKICIDKECKDISVDEYSDYVFYIKINDKDVTDEKAILLSAGTKYKISFGYKLEGEKSEGIDMYYLQIKDEFGTIIKGEKEDVWRTGDGDEEFFYWTAKSGAFTFKVAFAKKDDFFSENIVKIIEKKVVIK